MNKELKTNLMDKFKNDIFSINRELDRNTRSINDLSKKQRVLKKAKHELTQLINKINGY